MGREELRRMKYEGQARRESRPTVRVVGVFRGLPFGTPMPSPPAPLPGSPGRRGEPGMR